MGVSLWGQGLRGVPVQWSPMLGGLCSKVQCITSNGHMGPPRQNDWLTDRHDRKHHLTATSLASGNKMMWLSLCKNCREVFWHKMFHWDAVSHLPERHIAPFTLVNLQMSSVSSAAGRHMLPVIYEHIYGEPHDKCLRWDWLSHRKFPIMRKATYFP